MSGINDKSSSFIPFVATNTNANASPLISLCKLHLEITKQDVSEDAHLRRAALCESVRVPVGRPVQRVAPAAHDEPVYREPPEEEGCRAAQGVSLDARYWPG